MSVTLRTEKGWQLVARGGLDQGIPEYEGADKLRSNAVLSINLWAFACAEKERRISRDAALRDELTRRARMHSDLARNVADLVDRSGLVVRPGWCSACFEHTEHRKVEGGRSLPAYLCGDCGAATLPCAAARCKNMASRGFGALRVPRYCAEHRHDIPSFDRGDARISDLSAFEEMLAFEKRNLAKTTKLAGAALVAAGAMTGVGVLAAPLIGGIVGTTIGGYTGAAATSYGLALLGGGSVLSGGFGMAGGTAVVAAVGGSLGGVVGAGLTNAYVTEDRSFSIEKLKSGPGVAVVVCSGFLTEGQRGWGDWERIVTERYPDSPVYRVHWGSEELKDLTAVVTGNFSKAATTVGARRLALKASKHAARKAGPIGGAMIVVDLVRNPWWRARERANKTGAIVSDLLARTDMDEVVLAGHSLGARAMICAAEALGTKANAPTVRELHLLGAAVGGKRDWSRLSRSVHQCAYNYHSGDDKVLKFFYSVVQGGAKAAGSAGMTTRFKNIKNVDVTSRVPDHSAYCKAISLT